jgi:DNA/RNA endonuclease YhcR with UshA esterase domain
MWTVARQANVPTVQVQDISAGMNWAYVQVRGVVPRYPSYDEQTGALSFWVDDGTGEILVAAYRNEGQELVAAARVPTIGDRVAVGGTLRLKEDFRSLVLNVPDHLEVERPVPVEVPAADVAGRLYQKVLVRGQVREVRMPYEGLTVLRIRDETGEIDVLYDTDMIRLQGEPARLVPGDSISVRGAVTSYKGTPQIALDTAQGLQRLRDEIPIAVRGQIGEIGPADLDRLVQIGGQVTNVHWLSSDGVAGLKCVLNDGTGEIPLVLWKDILAEMEDDIDRWEGTWLDVQAVVSTYRGGLELVPELARDVRVVQARPLVEARVLSSSGGDSRAPTATPVPLTTPIQMSTAAVSRTPTSNATNGRQDRAPTETPAVTLTPSPTPTLTWTVPVVPRRIEPLRVQTGFLTAAHVGQETAIAGTIEDASQFAGGVKFYVNDGSGRLAVWIPQTLYEQLRDTAGWIVNSQVRVSGRVDQYKDEIEVVPQRLVDLVLVARATPPEAPDTHIGELGVGDVGRRVTVEATIISVDIFSAGVKFKVDDGSGQITLLLWQDVHDAVSGSEGLVVEARIRATGKVDEYRGELELVPGMGTDVVVIAAQAF